MGIAWLDADASPPMDAPVLRTGGLPLLGKAQEWPECARCEVPMLFRAQIPLGITSLASPADDRLMLVFECHAETEYGPCDAGTVLLSTGDRGPREAPLLRQFDVVIDHLGEDPQRVLQLCAALGDGKSAGGPAPPLPWVLARSMPASIADETLSALLAAGAKATKHPSSTVVLPETHGGVLVAFDDGQPGMSKTTLPPLQGLVAGVGRKRMRGLIGGATPGYRDHSFVCSCGRSTRTAVRLLAVRGGATEPSLGPAVAQLCLACSTGSLHRSGA
ncbi:MAG: hypothetical protein IPK60_15105 [Sandaracinaceae bacterium]|jgi:hypothetical protein|nr:hypothetical protein [Sandaracinaceae bacterium]